MGIPGGYSRSRKGRSINPGRRFRDVRGDKEDERAEWSEGEEYRGGAECTGRVKALADDHRYERKREEHREERERGRTRGIGAGERKRDEGFTAAVMFVGSRNFGVSESGEESYLNEPG